MLFCWHLFPTRYVLIWLAFEVKSAKIYLREILGQANKLLCSTGFIVRVFGILNWEKTLLLFRKHVRYIYESGEYTGLKNEYLDLTYKPCR